MTRTTSVLAGLCMLLGAACPAWAQANVSGSYSLTGSTTNASGPQAGQVPTTWAGTEDLTQPTGSTDIFGSGTLNTQTINETGFISGGVISIFIGGFSIGTTPANIMLQGTLSTSGTIDGAMTGRTFDGLTTWSGTFSKTPGARPCPNRKVITHCLSIITENRNEQKVVERCLGRAGAEMLGEPDALIHTIEVSIQDLRIVRFALGPSWIPYRRTDVPCPGSFFPALYPVRPGRTTVSVRVDNEVFTRDVEVIRYIPDVRWHFVLMPEIDTAFRVGDETPFGNFGVRGPGAWGWSDFVLGGQAAFNRETTAMDAYSFRVHAQGPEPPSDCLDREVPVRIDSMRAAKARTFVSRDLAGNGSGVEYEIESTCNAPNSPLKGSAIASSRYLPLHRRNETSTIRMGAFNFSPGRVVPGFRHATWPDSLVRDTGYHMVSVWHMRLTFVPGPGPIPTVSGQFRISQPNFCVVQVLCPPSQEAVE